MGEETLVSSIGRHFRNLGNHVAQRHKVNGSWVDLSYGEMGEIVARVAAGLVALGLKKGDRISLLSANRIEWAHCDLGILFAGGVTVTIYPTSIQREVFYILENSDSEMVFVEDEVQLQKVQEVLEELPNLRKIIVISGKPKTNEQVLTLSDLIETGSKRLEENPDLPMLREKEIDSEDLAAIIYTSGTTGPPKGVMLNHRNILSAITSTTDRFGDISEIEKILSFLPLSHALERIGGHFMPLVFGKTIAYTESLEKLGDNFREIKPEIALAVPRVFEKVFARIQNQLNSASPTRQALFKWAYNVGRTALVFRQKNVALPFWLSIRHAIADRFVFSKIRDVLGGRLKYFVSGGAPLDATIAEFFFSMGILVMEGWGATETSAPSTMNMPDAFKIGSVGRPLPGVEVKVEDDGELLIRGPNVCLGYWKMPEQSAETFDQDGWYHTGDVGRVDDDGYFYITDRKKELIITSGGKNISPQNIENKLKLSPLISNAMACGDKRNYITALLTLDIETVESKTAQKDIGSTDFTKDDMLIELIEKEVAKVNQDLPRFEQIKKFRILPEDFTVEADELSPSLKLKRRNIIARYQDLIDEMYES